MQRLSLCFSKEGKEGKKEGLARLETKQRRGEAKGPRPIDYRAGEDVGVCVVRHPQRVRERERTGTGKGAGLVW